MAAKKPKDWARIDNGAFVHMRKPYSFDRDDWNLEIILARWEGGAQSEWVTWLYNRADGSCSGGNYFDTREQALSDFKDRGNVKLMTHNQEPVEDLPPGNWEKVSKPPALGSDQAGMLRVIKEKGSWHAQCGWHWGAMIRANLCSIFAAYIQGYFGIDLGDFIQIANVDIFTILIGKRQAFYSPATRRTIVYGLCAHGV